MLARTSKNYGSICFPDPIVPAQSRSTASDRVPLLMSRKICSTFAGLAVLSLIWLQRPPASIPSGRTGSTRSVSSCSHPQSRTSISSGTRASSPARATSSQVHPQSARSAKAPLNRVAFQRGGRRIVAKSAIGKPKPSSRRDLAQARRTNSATPMLSSSKNGRTLRASSKRGRLQATSPKPRPTAMHAAVQRSSQAPMMGVHHDRSDGPLTSSKRGRLQATSLKPRPTAMHTAVHRSRKTPMVGAHNDRFDGPLTYWSRWRPLHVTRRAQADPNFAANVGQAIDTVRRDHALLPGTAPGVSVADPGISLEIAQVSGLRFMGLAQYRQFWDNFRQGTELISVSARSEVTNVVHSGLYLRVRWRLVMVPREVVSKDQARSAVQAARGALENFQGRIPWGNADLFQAGSSFLGQAEEWASEGTGADSSATQRIVDFNSVYELDPWNGSRLPACSSGGKQLWCLVG